jgi:hypothetical protein
MTTTSSQSGSSGTPTGVSSRDVPEGGALQQTAEYADRGVRANCVCPCVTAANVAQTSKRSSVLADDGVSSAACTGADGPSGWT